MKKIQKKQYLMPRLNIKSKIIVTFLGLLFISLIFFEYFIRIYSTKISIIIITIYLILLVYGISILFSKMITYPIITLINGANTIGNRDLEFRFDVKTGDEFEELATSFNNIISNFIEHMSEMQQSSVDSWNEVYEDLQEQMEEIRRTTAEKERMQKELEIAKSIQQSFLPDRVPEIKGIEIAASNIPAKEVGGDFYDFIPIAKNKLGISIADVSGKGIPAALFMALSRTLIQASTTGNQNVANAIKQANELIFSDSKSGMFVTLFYAILDSEKMFIKYINAGHNPPLLFRKEEDNIQFLKAKGIALGVIEDIELEEKEIELKKGDIIVLYTDGITEAFNEKEEQFSTERLIKLIKENPHLSTQQLIEKVHEEVKSFSGKQPQFDDITMMILKII